MNVRTHLQAGRFFYMNGTRVYEVEGGDSLVKIARAAYGDAAQWPKIYSANRDVIGGNPNRIKPGLVLKLP
jgi:nucleoid-associated protein YgaU